MTKDNINNYSWGISGKALNSIAWNNRGNILSQTKNTVTYSYIYDKKNQLKQEKRSNSMLSAWTYDANGNRKTETKGSGTAKTVTCYTKSDLVKSDGTWNYNYDANGNMIYKGKVATAKSGDGLFAGWIFSATAGEVWTYEYDLCNRLVKVRYSNAGTNGLQQVAEYKYDYRDLMVCRITGSVSSAVSEYFAYDMDGKLLYTEKGSEKHDYVYANGKLWCEVVTNGSTKNTYYHHTDHLGTTVCITNSSGSVVWQCEKEAFGTVLSKTNSSFTPNFTGKFLDQNTGLYYFNARWYDAEMGRFITEDPARDGVNWYVYCSNNPFIFTDPNGRYTDEWIKGMPSSARNYIKYMEPNQFSQHQWTVENGFSSYKDKNNNTKYFWQTACFATSILNVVSAVYQVEKNDILTEFQAIGALKAAIDAGHIDSNDAYVSNIPAAANAMASYLDMNGTFTNNESNPQYMIYAIDKTTYKHFVNAIINFIGSKYFDVWDGKTKDLTKTTIDDNEEVVTENLVNLQKDRPIRGLDYTQNN